MQGNDDSFLRVDVDTLAEDAGRPESPAFPKPPRMVRYLYCELLIYRYLKISRYAHASPQFHSYKASSARIDRLNWVIIGN